MKPKIQYRKSIRRPDLLAITFAAAGLSALAMPSARAADYSWNTTSGTWDTTTANWTGGGAVWVDGAPNNPTFANTATPSTITLAGDRNAGAIKSGNATNNYNYIFTGSGVTLAGATFAMQGGGTNNSQDAVGSHTIFNGSLNLNLGSGNVTIGRGNLEFGGSGIYTVGNITTNGDWGVFRMSGTAQVTATNINMLHATAQGQTGGFDLNGGTLVAGQIRAVGTGTAGAAGVWTIRNTINGATIKPSQSNTAFLQVNASSIGAINGTDAGNNVWIGNNGATFDTNGHDIGTATSFRDDTAAVGSLSKSGLGRLTISGVSTYTGATTINAGTLKVNGTLAAGSAVAVNGGGTLAGTGTVNGPVTLANGSTAGTQGEISLADGAFGTLTLSNAAGLTLGGSAGNLSKLKFDVGTSNADLLSLETNVLNVAAGGASITITPTGIAAGNTFDLVSFGSGAGAGFATGSGTTVGSLTLANPNITFGVSGSLTVTADRVQLVTSGASAPGVAYWSGVKGTTWASNDGTNGNFTNNANGTGFVGAFPSSFTDVIFAANGNGAPANLTNTLGQDFSINSLTFAGGTAASNISGGNQLTLESGITLENGNGGATLAMTTLALGNFQTWANSSASNLTVSAAVTGTNGMSIDNTGAGKTILSGINTHSGGTTLIAGTLQMSGTGTLGAAAGPLTINDGTLDLHGTSQTVASLNGTGGTILNNSTGTASTLSAGIGTYEGVIADNTSGTGTTALTKTGGGLLILLGNNTYTGKTTINGGTLQTASNERIANASVMEINNGGKFVIQGFTETIGGLSSVTGNTNLVQNQETGGSDIGTLIIDTGGGDFTFDGILRNNFQSTGTLAVIKNGAGTQTITATNNFLVGTSIEFTGGLTINGGTFRLWDQGTTNAFYTNGKVISTFASDVVNNAQFALENTGTANVTFGKVISGTGALTSTGLITLSALNTYTGSTTVAGGTLEIPSPYLNDSSSVTVATGAVLNLTHSGNDVVGSLILGGVTQPNGVYGASNSGGRITGTGRIQVGALGGFALWSSVNAGNQSADQDFDLDGVENGVEYFMGQTGSTFTSNPALTGGSVTWNNGGNIASTAYGTRFLVQTSPDLVFWTDVLSNDPKLANTPASVSYTPGTTPGKVFVRLRVTPD